MVRIFHEHGIEVLLDVVFNHTFEGGDDLAEPGCVGPTVSFRGLDNRSYYLLNDTDRLRYLNE